MPATIAQTIARLEGQAALLTERTGIQWTIGYIGNVTGANDDRAWYAFADHPGRIGTSDDRIGGVTTDELPMLTTILHGALTLARIQNTRR